MAHHGKQSDEGPEPTSTSNPLVRLADQNQLDFEIDFYGGILERLPDYVDVLRVMGNYLTLKGRYAQGLVIDKRLVQLRPKDPLAHYNLACSYALRSVQNWPCEPCGWPSNLAIAIFAICARITILTRFAMIRDSASYCASTKTIKRRRPQSAALFGMRELDPNTVHEPPLPGQRRPFHRSFGQSCPSDFATKPRALTDKVTTVADAVARLVHDGDYLAIGGFGCARVPISVVHEILRQGKQNLGFAGHTATHDFQVLCAGNLMGRGKTLSQVDIAYVVGLEARGLSPHARRVLESGDVACSEWTNYALAVRFKAAAMGLPFLPARSMLGTDTFRYSGATRNCLPIYGRTTRGPSGRSFPMWQRFTCTKPIAMATAASWVPPSPIDLARAAKRLIVTCERLIPNDEIRREPTRTVIPFFCVDAVCEVPYGSYPGNMPYEYFSDENHVRQWLEAEKNLDSFREFLNHYIYDVRSFTEYLHRCGGLDRLQELRRQEFLLEVGPRSRESVRGNSSRYSC